MTVINMNRPSDVRILAFCQWQSRQPAVMPKAEWRAAADSAGFTDIRDRDLPRAAAVLRALAATEYQHANLLEAEISGGMNDDYYDRLEKLHRDGVTLNELSPSIGTPEEWLAASITHLKAAGCEQSGGFIRVSSAAVSLLLYRIEQLEHGGEPWTGNAA